MTNFFTQAVPSTLLWLKTKMKDESLGTSVIATIVLSFFIFPCSIFLKRINTVQKIERYVEVGKLRPHTSQDSSIVDINLKFNIGSLSSESVQENVDSVIFRNHSIEKECYQYRWANNSINFDSCYNIVSNIERTKRMTCCYYAIFENGPHNKITSINVNDSEWKNVSGNETSSITLVKNEKSGNNIKSTFVKYSSVESPAIYNKVSDHTLWLIAPYDISRAVVKCKIVHPQGSGKISSVVMKFGGVTYLQSSDVEPDRKTLYELHFTDPDNIATLAVAKDIPSFYLTFPEVEVVQMMRNFIVTAILTILITLWFKYIFFIILFLLKKLFESGKIKRLKK